MRENRLSGLGGGRRREPFSIHIFGRLCAGTFQPVVKSEIPVYVKGSA
jgi:hypothetical protein